MSLTHDLRRMKRSRLHIVTTVPILALMLSATTSPARAQSGSRHDNEAKSPKQIFFEGYFQGSESDTLQGSPPEGFMVDGRVTGIATRLGQFTLAYKDVVKLPEGSATGNAEVIAANGDHLFTSLVGQGAPADSHIPTLNSVTEINTVTGGTGRFSGATGVFTVIRLIDVATGFTSGSVHGTIVVPRPAESDR